MQDEDAQSVSNTTTFPGSLAQSDESAKRPISRKRKATRALDCQSPALCQHGGHLPRFKRLAQKPTPNNDQQASCISDKSPRPKAPRALARSTWEGSNRPGRASFQPVGGVVETSMVAAGGGPGNQQFTNAVVAPVPPIHRPDMMFNQLPNGGTILASCNLNPDPWEYLTAFGLHSPDLGPANAHAHNIAPGVTMELAVPTAEEERTERAKQQHSGRSHECPWGSLLEKIVSVELGVSQLSRNARKDPLQQLFLEELDILLEGFVELKQLYLLLRKSVQDSNKSLRPA